MCLPSPRLRRAVSLSPARMAEEFYVQAGTEAEALSLADFDQPWGSGSESSAIDAFGHEKNSIRGDFGKLQEQRFNFDQIVFGRDDEFQLKRIFSNPFGDDRRLEAGGFVFLSPSGVARGGRGGVGKLGAERGQVAGDAVRKNSASGFDGDVFTLFF